MEPNAILAQQWLAAMGITAFLAAGKVRVDHALARKVQTMESDARAVFTRFTSRRKFAPIPDEPDWARRLDFEQLADDIYEPAAPDDLSRRLDGFPDALIGDLAISASRALTWLRNQLPATRYESFGGLKYKEPSARDKEAFLRAVDVLDSPLTVLADLEAGILSTDQVDALRGGYPDLYGYWQQLALESLETADLPIKKEKQLKVFLGASTLTPELASAVSALGDEIIAESQGGGGQGQSAEFYGSTSARMAAD